MPESDLLKQIAELQALNIELLIGDEKRRNMLGLFRKKLFFKSGSKIGYTKIGRHRKAYSLSPKHRKKTILDLCPFILLSTYKICD